MIEKLIRQISPKSVPVDVKSAVDISVKEWGVDE